MFYEKTSYSLIIALPPMRGKMTISADFEFYEACAVNEKIRLAESVGFKNDNVEKNDQICQHFLDPSACRASRRNDAAVYPGQRTNASQFSIAPMQFFQTK